MITNESDIAWAAGLLEGEGTFRLKAGRRPILAAHMTDLDVLERLADVFGVGTIKKMRKQEPHHKQSWRWDVIRASEGAMVMELVKDYMMSRRRQRIDECLKVWYDILERKMVEKEFRQIRDETARQHWHSGLSLRETARVVTEETGVPTSHESVRRAVKPD